MRKQLKKFGHATRGLWALTSGEPHFRIHLLATTAVIVSGALMGISLLEWFMLIVAISMVLMAEALNTVIERMMDLLHPEVHPKVKVIKDVSAAAVLIAAVAAIVIGVLVFYDDVRSLLESGTDSVGVSVSVANSFC